MPINLTVLVLATAIIIMVFCIMYYLRQIKQHRNELRVLKGRRTMLDKHISRLQNCLPDKPDIPSKERRNIDIILNELMRIYNHRQKNILNHEDLIKLQQYKIAILQNPLETKHSQDEIREHQKNDESISVDISSGKSSKPSPKQRDSIEKRLLDKISQMNQNQSK